MQKGFAGVFILIGILVVGLGIAGAWYIKLIQIPNFPPPGCYYQEVQCIKVPCNPVLTCGTPSPSPKSASQVVSSPAPIANSVQNGVDETANWKTYDAYIPATDQINKFSLKYPKEWHQEVSGMMSVYAANWVSFTPIPIGQFVNLGLVRVSIGVESNEKKQSSKEFVDSLVTEQQLCPYADHIKIMPDIPDSLKNLDVTIVEGLCGQYTQGPNMVISKGNAFLILASDFAGGISDRDRNLVYQIYATLKFSDKSEFATIVNWKTYTNTTYGFSFKYPGDYFQDQEDTMSGVYLAPSQGHGGNGPKFLNAGDVWINAYIDTYKVYSHFYEYFDFISKENPSDHASLQKVPAMIGWVKGYKITYESPNMLGNAKVPHYEGLVLKNGWALSIALSAWTQKDLDARKDMLDQILSTFKFTN